MSFHYAGKLTLTKIKDAFAIMKNFVLEERSKHNQIIQNNNSLPSSNGIGTGGNSSVNQGNDELLKQISDLKSSLLEREHEISILVNMVKKGSQNNPLVYVYNMLCLM